jgi:hypothetical protein
MVNVATCSLIGKKAPFRPLSRLRGPRGGASFRDMDQDLAWETDRLRRMTADEKVRVAQSLWREVWNAAAAGVRARHPDWPEPQVQDGVRELMRGASGP